jgi:HSP20 family protein
MSTTKQKRHADDDLILFPEAERAVSANAESRTEDGWFNDDEGRLAIDISETEKEIVILSPIAGVKPEDLEVFMHNDMFTIRGNRHQDLGVVPGGKHIVRECHWGAFSRTVIMPIEIDADAITATIKDGVLTVRMPKTERSRRIAVKEI